MIKRYGPYITGACSAIVASVLVGMSNFWAWFGVACFVSVCLVIFSCVMAGVIQAIRTKYEDEVLTKYGITPLDTPERHLDWIKTDAKTGHGREAFEGEVPQEVRLWADHMNETLDASFDQDGSLGIVIGMVPNVSDDSGEVHWTYTMSRRMHPAAFMGMLDAFSQQIPVLMAAQGIEDEEDDGHSGKA